jgi:hypothetical protein
MGQVSAGMGLFTSGLKSSCLKGASAFLQPPEATAFNIRGHY